MKAPTRFPGICRHAKFLRVSRNHLYACLIGERKMGRDLQSRYDSLIESEREGAANAAEIAAAKCPFGEWMSTEAISDAMIEEAKGEFGDAVFIVGRKLVFDATRVVLKCRTKGEEHFASIEFIEGTELTYGSKTADSPEPA